MTFTIILSIGAKATLVASLEKANAPYSNTALTNRVLIIFIIELSYSTVELSDTKRITGAPIYYNPTNTGSTG